VQELTAAQDVNPYVKEEVAVWDKLDLAEIYATVTG